jgi:transcriptional regulator with XRE-family HTH domain
MQYQSYLAGFAQTLRQAREAKGWSQRELASRSGMTQANISKIETGQADLRLSTFVELARFLDLDVTLAPRQAAPAINAIVRTTSAARTPAEVARHIERIGAAALALRAYAARPRHPVTDDFLQAVERLAFQAAQLKLTGSSYAAPFAARELAHIAQQATTAGNMVSMLKEAGADGVYLKSMKGATTRIASAARDLAALRNSIVQRDKDDERPAYTLDEEEEV